MRIADDKYLIAGFFRSLQWDQAKEAQAFKHKSKFGDAIRRYLHEECGVPDGIDEATEIEKAVGRVQLAIRSRWAKKAASTRARRKKRKAQELIRRAKNAIKRFVALKSPLLFGAQLPIQHRPVRPNKIKPPRKVA